MCRKIIVVEKKFLRTEPYKYIWLFHTKKHVFNVFYFLDVFLIYFRPTNELKYTLFEYHELSIYSNIHLSICFQYWECFALIKLHY